MLWRSCFFFEAGLVKFDTNIQSVQSGLLFLSPGDYLSLLRVFSAFRMARYLMAHDPESKCERTDWYAAIDAAEFR